MKQLFILIDDDPANNLVCKINLRKAFPEIESVAFEKPNEGLDFILTEIREHDPGQFIIFLDINMPQLSGFDILDRLVTESMDPLKKLQIFMLSSSIDSRDKDKARTYNIVKGYIEKPLTIELAREILSTPLSNYN